MITEILSRKRSKHYDDHVDRALVKFTFTESSRRDHGEKEMMALLVSTGRYAFLSHTPGPLSSMLIYKFLHMRQHCWVRRAVHSAYNPDHCMSFQSRAEVAVHQPTTYKQQCTFVSSSHTRQTGSGICRQRNMSILP